MHSTVPCPPGLEMDSHPIGPSEMEEGSVTFSPPRSTSSQTGEFESGTWNDDPMDWLLPNRGRIVERQRWSIHSRLQRCIEISMLLRNTSDALKNDTDRNLVRFRDVFLRKECCSLHHFLCLLIQVY